jgi:hypothetical protein
MLCWDESFYFWLVSLKNTYFIEFDVGFGMIPSFFSILFVAMLPESPKFLLIHKKNREQAIKSLHFYQGNTGLV